ncbi:MAG: hypothetical protein HYR71_07570 [Chloroflexi bacterium]|nr:hypothetical protein [Chloroflexota bacterium]
MSRYLSPLTLCWLLIAAVGLFTLVRIGSDYLSTIDSLQRFRWRTVQFTLPASDTSQTELILEAQNRSSLDLTMKDLEVYLWANDLTVGKTYGRFEPRPILSGQAESLRLLIQLDAGQLRDALAKAYPLGRWRVTGSYKVTAPLAGVDFVYRLSLDVQP